MYISLAVGDDLSLIPARAIFYILSFRAFVEISRFVESDNVLKSCHDRVHCSTLLAAPGMLHLRDTNTIPAGLRFSGERALKLHSTRAT